MWIVKNRADASDAIIMPTEREAYNYCRDMGNTYYYEWLSDKAYMERKTKEWKQQKREALNTI